MPVKWAVAPGSLVALASCVVDNHFLVSHKRARESRTCTQNANLKGEWVASLDKMAVELVETLGLVCLENLSINHHFCLENFEQKSVVVKVDGWTEMTSNSNQNVSEAMG